jgi:hypothetical protein
MSVDKEKLLAAVLARYNESQAPFWRGLLGARSSHQHEWTAHGVAMLVIDVLEEYEKQKEAQT